MAVRIASGGALLFVIAALPVLAFAFESQGGGRAGGSGTGGGTQIVSSLSPVRGLPALAMVRLNSKGDPHPHILLLAHVNEKGLYVEDKHEYFPYPAFSPLVCCQKCRNDPDCVYWKVGKSSHSENWLCITMLGAQCASGAITGSAPLTSGDDVQNYLHGFDCLAAKSVP
ncbi:hypothetical protein KFL_016140010 [Klebsormidium nitens]|uniref:Uncharacterized protein n=1 Tax=Klebsormidium nitens TaxID=105231 RepID=A0A1Y1IS77_KLENI|nr:hypothetical protein KFL_016140010 [Klebsormidium nitens]|eukprot:GAQ93524.1 hypothetical protein KFL_016140010 [Klebsormidium nitens]